MKSNHISEKLCHFHTCNVGSEESFQIFDCTVNRCRISSPRGCGRPGNKSECSNGRSIWRDFEKLNLAVIQPRHKVTLGLGSVRRPQSLVGTPLDTKVLQLAHPGAASRFQNSRKSNNFQSKNSPFKREQILRHQTPSDDHWIETYCCSQIYSRAMEGVMAMMAVVVLVENICHKLISRLVLLIENIRQWRDYWLIDIINAQYSGTCLICLILTPLAATILFNIPRCSMWQVPLYHSVGRICIEEAKVHHLLLALR